MTFEPFSWSDLASWKQIDIIKRSKIDSLHDTNIDCLLWHATMRSQYNIRDRLFNLQWVFLEKIFSVSKLDWNISSVSDMGRNILKALYALKNGFYRNKIMSQQIFRCATKQTKIFLLWNKNHRGWSLTSIAFRFQFIHIFKLWSTKTIRNSTHQMVCFIFMQV